MAATAPQPKQDLRIYGADFKGASGTIRTSEVGPPDTPANSRAGTAGPADSAVRKAESDPAVPPPLTSKDAPQSPSNAGQQQQQARTPQNSRPQVSVVYKRLPQKSKDRLEEALIGWAAWHASAYGNDPDDSQDSLILNITSVQQQPRCSGRLRFEPLVLSAAEGTSVDANVAAASAWMDIPEAGEEQQQLVGKGAFNLAYEKGGSVPQYDRGVLTPLGQGTGSKAQQDAAVPSPAPRPNRAPQRCFNCGSYSHGLRDCWQPRNAAAVTAARAEFTAASGSGTIAGMKLPSRYFTSMDGAADTSERGDGTSRPAADGEPAPGQLSAELRAALGISPLAPPPWLARMRRLGYPPGYIAPDAEAVVDADDTDEVQLVFGDDAPAEVHAAWAAVEPRNTAGASAPAACAPGGRSPAPASGADADAHADAGASAAAASGEAPDEAATEAQAALVARLVAALSGAVFDCGDARGVALSGSPEGVNLPDARLESDLVTALTSSMPIDKAAQLAAAALQATAGSSSGSALTRRQIKRALIMASKRQAAFPGLNAPLPDGADVAAWSATEHEAKAGQSQHKRPALAGSKRAHPEPQSTGAALLDGRAAGGMLSPAHGQQHKRQALGSSPAGTADGPMQLMNGQHGPPQPIWRPDHGQQSAVMQPMYSPPPQQRQQGAQQLLPLQAYSSGYASQSAQGAAGAAAPQSAAIPGLQSPAPGVAQQQHQQHQQGAQAQPSWVQHPPMAPPPPPPSSPVPPAPQMQSASTQPPSQQPSWPRVQPTGAQQGERHAPPPQLGPPYAQQPAPQQQQQQRVVQALPDWQPMQQQAAAPDSNAWQQTYLTPAAQQAWSPQQRQPPPQPQQYQPQQLPQLQLWQQRYTPQMASASIGGWQQQQQRYVPPQPPLPAPDSGGWPDQQQASLPPVQQPSPHQNVAPGHSQSLQQQLQQQWQQAAWH